MTPILSVIVPINGVEGQLRECLDSLTSQTLAGIEIIAINDASADMCSRILADFEARFDNVRVVTHDSPLGPGRCRNAGVALARGSYIGFVDGDDWVSADYYEAAITTAQAAQADVVILDHVRAFPDGKLEANRSASTLRTAPSGGFTIDEHPDVLRNIPTVWNKIFRKDFFDQPQFKFDDGWYEDVPITCLSLCTARSIAVARAGTYYYRQRPSSILFSTDDDGHLVVVGRYQTLLDDLAMNGVSDRIVRHIFAYSVWHLRLVERRGLTRFTELGLERLREALEDYFAKFGHLFSAGLLTRADVTWYLEVTGAVAETPTAVGAARKAIDVPRRKAKQLRATIRSEKIKRRRALFYGRAKQDPVDDRLVLFASYWFKSPSGNPLAIYEELVRRSPGTRCVWVLDGRAPARGLPRHAYVRQGWREYYDLLGRARYFVNNVNFPNFVEKRPGTIELQTTHGTPLKVMGVHESRAPSSDLNINSMLGRAARWDYCLSANPFSSEIWQGAYPTGFELLESGYPRNDILHRFSERDAVDVRRQLGIGQDELVVLYAPTYRQLKNRRVTPTIDFDRLAAAAGPGVRILNRSHYFISARTQSNGNVIDVSDFPITNELLIACDVLLTDYSSIMFDFANLRRPIINFVPDCDDYMAERATYFDIRSKNAGLVALDEAELRAMIADRAWDDAPVQSAANAFSDEFTGFDDGFAAKRVVERVFGDILDD